MMDHVRLQSHELQRAAKGGNLEMEPWGFSSVELVRVVNHKRLFRGLSQRIRFAIASKKIPMVLTPHISVFTFCFCDMFL